MLVFLHSRNDGLGETVRVNVWIDEEEDDVKSRMRGPRGETMTFSKELRKLICKSVKDLFVILSIFLGLFSIT